MAMKALDFYNLTQKYIHSDEHLKQDEETKRKELESFNNHFNNLFDQESADMDDEEFEAYKAQFKPYEANKQISPQGRSHEFARRIQEAKKSEAWENLPDNEKAKYNQVIGQKYRELRLAEGLPIEPVEYDAKADAAQNTVKEWTGIEPQNQPQQVNDLSWKTGAKSVGKSLGRVPGSLVSTGMGAAGFGYDLLGSGLQVLPWQWTKDLGQLSKDTGAVLGTAANAVDTFNRNILPPEQKQSSSVGEWWNDRNAEQKALGILDEAPEQFFTFLLPMLTGHAAAKSAQLAQEGKLGGWLGKLLNRIRTSPKYSKWFKDSASGLEKGLVSANRFLSGIDPQKAQKVGTFVGSSAIEASEMAKSAYRNQGEIRSPLNMLAHALVAGKLESLVPEKLGGIFSPQTRALLRRDFGKGAWKSSAHFIKNLGKDTIANLFEEGLTELTQTYVEQSADMYNSKGMTADGIAPVHDVIAVKDILEKDGINGLIKEAGRNERVADIFMATLFGGITGGVGTAMAHPVNYVRYNTSPEGYLDRYRENRENLLNDINNSSLSEDERNQKRQELDRLEDAKNKWELSNPLNSGDGQYTTVMRSLHEMADPETSEDDLKDAIRTLSELNDNELLYYIGRLINAGWKTNDTFNKNLEKLFKYDTVLQNWGERDAISKFLRGEQLTSEEERIVQSALNKYSGQTSDIGGALNQEIDYLNQQPNTLWNPLFSDSNDIQQRTQQVQSGINRFYQPDTQQISQQNTQQTSQQSQQQTPQEPPLVNVNSNNEQNATPQQQQNIQQTQQDPRIQQIQNRIRQLEQQKAKDEQEKEQLRQQIVQQQKTGANANIQGQPLPDGRHGFIGNKARLKAGDIDTECNYAIVELADLQTLSEEENPRLRNERQAYQNTVSERARNLDPDLLIDNSVGAQNGPIVVDQNLKVESGNGRTLSLREAYANRRGEGEYSNTENDAGYGRADLYRNKLIAEAPKYGISSEQVMQMQQPVLVRIRVNDSNINAKDFYAKANNSQQESMSSTETALVDGEKVKPFLNQFEAIGDIRAKSNLKFVKSFLEKICSPYELNSMFTADGRSLSEAGEKRINNAIIASAYGNSEIVSLLTELGNEEIQTILNGLAMAAPDTAKLMGEVKSGAVHDVDFSKDLADAIRTIKNIRQNPDMNRLIKQLGSVSEVYLRQGLLGDDGLSPTARLFIGALGNLNNKETICNFLKSVNNTVRAEGNPNQLEMFEANTKPSDEVFVERAIRNMGLEYRNGKPIADDIERLKQGPVHVASNDDFHAEDAQGRRYSLGQTENTNTRTPEENYQLLMNQEPIDISINPLSNLVGKEQRTEAKNIYKRLLKIRVKTTDGKTVNFTNTGYKELKNHSANPLTLQIIPNLDELVRNAIYLYSEANHEQKRYNVDQYHYYTVKAQLINPETSKKEDYAVRIVLREDTNGNIFYDGDSTEITKIGKLREQSHRVPNTGNHVAPTNSLIKYFENVNFNKKKKLLDKAQSNHIGKTNTPSAISGGSFSNLSISENDDLSSRRNSLSNSEDYRTEAERLADDGTTATREEFDNVIQNMNESLDPDAGISFEIYDSVEDFNKGRADNDKAPSDANAFIDKETGKIVFFRDKLTTLTRLKQVIAHELVGHEGIERLLGGRYYDVFLKSIRKLASRDGRVGKLLAQVQRTYGRFYSPESHQMYEELGAHLAELYARKPERFSDRVHNYIRKLKVMFRNALRNWGVDIEFNQVDLEDIFAKARESVETRNTNKSTNDSGRRYSRRRKVDDKNQLKFFDYDREDNQDYSEEEDSEESLGNEFADLYDRLEKESSEFDDYEEDFVDDEESEYPDEYYGKDGWKLIQSYQENGNVIYDILPRILEEDYESVSDPFSDYYNSEIPAPVQALLKITNNGELLGDLDYYLNNAEGNLPGSEAIDLLEHLKNHIKETYYKPFANKIIRNCDKAIDMIRNGEFKEGVIKPVSIEELERQDIKKMPEDSWEAKQRIMKEKGLVEDSTYWDYKNKTFYSLSSEAKQIKQKAIDNGTFLKAPNGKDSNHGEDTDINNIPAPRHYSLVSDPKLLDKLESEPTVKVYRAMQLIDGKLYPPMAAKIEGKGVKPTEFDRWYQADENPDIIVWRENSKGEKVAYFKLDKANGKSIYARYAPYWHTSRTPLNDQFKEAWNRHNLVTVECEIPESELTSGYTAQYAEKPVGETEWHEGPVANRLGKVGKPRRVILSRWNKVTRIVPESEVADVITKTLKDTGIGIPENTVTPSLLEELKKRDVIIEPPEKGQKKSNDSMYDRFGNRYDGKPIRFSLSSSDKLNLNGEDYSVATIEDYAKGWFYDSFEWDIDPDNGSDTPIDIVGAKVVGSRAKGRYNNNSDLDIVLEYDDPTDSWSEDSVYNILNEQPHELNGVKVDINPIKKEDSGTIEEWLDRNYDYDKNEDKGRRYSLGNSAYENVNLSENSDIYNYDFLTSLPDMNVVTLPDVSKVRPSGKVDTDLVEKNAYDNLKKVGDYDSSRRVFFVTNDYTGRNLSIGKKAIRHGLNGELPRLLTNSRLASVIGDVVKSAVPINGLKNKADVDGTYAMASYAEDGNGRKFVAIVTVEQRNNKVDNIEVYDVTHSVSGRQQKDGSLVAYKEAQGLPYSGIALSKLPSKISIADLLENVKSTYQSILSNDVLSHFNEERNPDGYYSNRVKFSLSSPVESQQFKNWFGDWGNDPSNASKVVDEDGRPLVVYHGTDADFEAFDHTKGRSGMDIQGMFFSPWEIDAKGYGKNLGKFYLNLRNPANEDAAYKALRKFQGQNYAGKKAREYLIKQGYDGVIMGVKGQPEEYIAFYPNQIKSSTENNGNFDRNDDRYRFSLAGTKAKTANIATLDEARKMLADGADKKEVWAKTGWYIARDGKPRFEISDRDFKFKKKLFGMLMPKSGKLDVVIQHEKLFEAYPFLKDINVKFLKDKNDGTGGYFDRKNSLIVVTDHGGEKQMEKTLIHEIQHAIQDYENFAKGTTINHHDYISASKKLAEEFKKEHLKDIDDDEIRKVFDNYIDFINIDLTRAGIKGKDRVEAEKILEENMDDASWNLRIVLAEKKNFDFDAKRIFKSYSKDKYFLDNHPEKIAEAKEHYENNKRIQKEVNHERFKLEKRIREIGYKYLDFLSDSLPEKIYDNYKRYYGEGEARVASKRLGYTNEERTGTMPEDDFDYDVDDSIIEGVEDGEERPLSSLRDTSATRSHPVARLNTAILGGSPNSYALGADREGSRRYSLCEFIDSGERFVDVQANQEEFDGLSDKQKINKAIKIIKDKFAQKVIGIDNRVFVNSSQAKEYGYPPKEINDKDIINAKMRASTELDNLVDAGTNFRTEEDGKDGHIHPDAKNFEYFDVLFKVGDQFYKGVINIKNNNRGRLFYDITKIENVTKDQTDSTGNIPAFGFLRDISMPDEKSSDKFSIAENSDNRNPAEDDNFDSSNSKRVYSLGSIIEQQRKQFEDYVDGKMGIKLSDDEKDTIKAILETDDDADLDLNDIPTFGERLGNAKESLKTFLGQLITGLIGDTESRADRKKAPYLWQKDHSTENVVETPYEISRRTKIEQGMKTREEEDRLVLKHLDADKNLFTGLIRKWTKPGALQDWMLKKASRILAPFQIMKPVEQLLFTVAENIMWDEAKQQMVIAPYRDTEYDKQTNRPIGYKYDPNEKNGKLALDIYNNKLNDEFKAIIKERSIANNKFREDFVNRVVPFEQAKLYLARFGRKRLEGASKKIVDGNDQQAYSYITKLKGVIDDLDYNNLISQYDQIKSIPDEQLGRNSAFINSIIGELAGNPAITTNGIDAKLNWLTTNKGLYGYAHHLVSIDPETGNGKPFNALGKISHPWIESIAGDRRGRKGDNSEYRSLLRADLERNRKEAEAEAANRWMEATENTYGITLEEAKNLEKLQKQGKGPGMPEGYEHRHKVVANFGKFRGKVIYLPDETFEAYQMIKDNRSLDSMKQFREFIQKMNNLNGRINEAMLWHPGKAMRDLMAGPFHLLEFLRDWSMKHPTEINDAAKAIWHGVKNSVSPGYWQSHSPESMGEYSESVIYQTQEGQSPTFGFIDSLFNYFQRAIPVGRTLEAMYKEINFAGGADIPLKRIFTTVGEELADKRGLTGQERERFIYDLVNDYAFDTGDLPEILGWLRGKKPDSKSQALGMISRATVPFMGYATRMIKQMITDPVTKGAIPLAKRAFGNVDSDSNLRSEISEISRPFFWLMLKALITAGLGGILPPPTAEEIQNMPGVPPSARTHGRFYVGDSDKGERWMSTKGLGQLETAYIMDDYLKGKSDIIDFSQEFITVHPVMKLIANAAGMTSEYDREVPFTAQVGRTLGSLLVPEITRFGPDIEKLIRSVFKLGISNRKKQNFLNGFLSQFGIPTGQVLVDREGHLRLSDTAIELLKLQGINIREIPFDTIEETTRAEASRISNDAKKIQKLRDYRAGKYAPKTEREFLKQDFGGDFSSVDEAEKAYSNLAERERRLVDTATKLHNKGHWTDLEDVAREKKEAAAEKRRLQNEGKPTKRRRPSRKRKVERPLLNDDLGYINNEIRKNISRQDEYQELYDKLMQNNKKHNPRRGVTRQLERLLKELK